MRISVRVRTNSKIVETKEIKSICEGERRFKVSVSEKPIGNSANKAVIRELARYFHVSQSAIKLILGRNYKEKIFEIYR